MTVFYFTSTGNSLAAAKAIGGTLISIPQVVDSPNLRFKDDMIGLVFPVYIFRLPKMVRRFLEKVEWEADYTFAVSTCGALPGAVMTQAKAILARRGQKLGYTASLVMVDNYLPNYDTGAQVASLPEKRVEENLARIVADIQSRKTQQTADGLGWQTATALMKLVETAFVGGKLGQQYIVNQNCTKCGICAKVCPAGNISVTDRVQYSDRCEGCLGCVHLCPQNAIHLKNEKSAARWRNPNVSLAELIASNNRLKGTKPQVNPAVDGGTD